MSVPREDGFGEGEATIGDMQKQDANSQMENNQKQDATLPIENVFFLWNRKTCVYLGAIVRMESQS